MSKDICIIDDCSINITIATMLINRNGRFGTITSYMEAEKALGALIHNKNNQELLPDYILLDLDMPGMNGWEFLDRFTALSPLSKIACDIFILSSSTDQRDIQRSKQYSSVRGYFSKPLTSIILDSIASRSLVSIS